MSNPAQLSSGSLPRRERLAALAAEGADQLGGAPPQATVRWALKAFPRQSVALVTSLQVTGMAILDMAIKIDPSLQVITIDSGRLPGETLNFVDEVGRHYGIQIEVLSPDATEVSEMVTQHGINLFYRAPELRLGCCEVRKVRPLNRRLQALDAWITGLRRDDSDERSATNEVEVDIEHGGMVKVNPLVQWSQEQLTGYVEANKVPMHPLYARGYTSIGCAPCTRPTAPGEDPRAGRWWWQEGAKECGLHYSLLVGDDGRTRVRLTSAKEEART